LSNFVQIYKDLTILYYVFLRLYIGASLIASFFSKKAALFYYGRKGVLNHIEHIMSSAETYKGTRYWFHCASVGEFEQARPLIEKIKEREPLTSIVITFFSPSGYELRKDYSLASAVFYLPMDTRANARKFVEYVKPNVAIFIKYEFWRNYLLVLKEQNIPLYLVSAIFRENQSFFKWWGGSFRKMLANFTHFFVQDNQSETLLRSIGIANVSVAGDTRFDRVFEITQNSKAIASLEVFTRDKVFSNEPDNSPNTNLNEYLSEQTIEQPTGPTIKHSTGPAIERPTGQTIKQSNDFTYNKMCCVAGSTWPPDQELLLNFMRQFATPASKSRDLLLEKPNNLTKESVKLAEEPNESSANKVELKLVIAPHEVDEAHIKKIESLFAAYKVVKFSDFSEVNNQLQAQPNNLLTKQNGISAHQNFSSAQIEELSSAQIFIIDTVGILSTAYRYGNFAYVGGGFGVGIHNILEAATYGLPVVFGPKYEKFKEAVDLIALGGAFTVTKDETETLERLSLDTEFRKHCSQICRDYVQTNRGATTNILKEINS